MTHKRQPALDCSPLPLGLGACLLSPLARAAGGDMRRDCGRRSRPSHAVPLPLGLGACLLTFLFLFTSCASPSVSTPASPLPSEVGVAPASAAPEESVVAPSADPSAEQPLASSATPRPTPADVEWVEWSNPDGEYAHVFFHYLISYPDRAYLSGNAFGESMDTFCVTPLEFKRALQALYDKGYVLCNLNDYTTKNPDGTVTLNKIKVPKGKTPLVLSFDDLSYAHENLGLGICDKVVIDPATGKLAMQTTPRDTDGNPTGDPFISYDNDVIPMLETFCEEHPDFAPFGVTAMICLTGYDGIFGYRTQSGSPNRESEIEAVKPIVQKLKDNGWYFGSHSYGHINVEKQSMKSLREDTEKWEAEVGTLLGGTKLFIYAFGNHPPMSDERNLYLAKNYDVLCSVGMSPYLSSHKTFFEMDRANIDGFTLRLYPFGKSDRYKPYMNPEEIYDQEGRGGRPYTYSDHAYIE